MNISYELSANLMSPHGQSLQTMQTLRLLGIEYHILVPQCRQIVAAHGQVHTWIALVKGRLLFLWEITIDILKMTGHRNVHTFSFEDQASRSAFKAVDFELDLPDLPEAILRVSVFLK